MTQNLTPAQQTQLENRDSTGRWKSKTHGDVDAEADVLGIGEEPESVSAGTAEDHLDRDDEFLGSGTEDFERGMARAGGAALDGKIAVVRATDKRILADDAADDIETGSEYGYREFTPDEFTAHYGDMPSQWDDPQRHQEDVDPGAYDLPAGVKLTTSEDFDYGHVIDQTTGESDFDNLYIVERSPAAPDPSAPNALTGDLDDQRRAYAAAKERMSAAKQDVVYRDYSRESQEEERAAESEFRVRAEALSVSEEGRQILADDHSDARWTENRLLQIDEVAEASRDNYGTDERVRELDRQRERYDQLTEPERLSLSRAQSMGDLPLISQYGEARQRRNEELAASGIGQDAESIALTEVKRSLPERTAMTVSYTGRDAEKNTTVTKVGSDYIRHTDETGRESTMPLSGVKAQRDRNGNILLTDPDSGGGLPFAVYSPHA